MQSPESQFVIDFYSFRQVTCVDFVSICIFFFILAKVYENFVYYNKHIYTLDQWFYPLITGSRTRSKLLSILLLAVLAHLRIDGSGMRVKLFLSGLSRIHTFSQAVYHSSIICALT